MNELFLNPELHLRIVGVLLLLLAASHVYIPRHLGWSHDLPKLTPVNREIFIVHCLFIVLLLVLTGVLSLCFAPLVAGPGPLARVVSAGLAVFWFARLLAQQLLYSPSLWRGIRLNTAVHILATIVWTYFAAVYGWIALR